MVPSVPIKHLNLSLHLSLTYMETTNMTNLFGKIKIWNKCNIFGWREYYTTFHCVSTYVIITHATLPLMITKLTTNLSQMVWVGPRVHKTDGISRKPFRFHETARSRLWKSVGISWLSYGVDRKSSPPYNRLVLHQRKVLLLGNNRIPRVFYPNTFKDEFALSCPFPFH